MTQQVAAGTDVASGDAASRPSRLRRTLSILRTVGWGVLLFLACAYGILANVAALYYIGEHDILRQPCLSKEALEKAVLASTILPGAIGLIALFRWRSRFDKLRALALEECNGRESLVEKRFAQVKKTRPLHRERACAYVFLFLGGIGGIAGFSGAHVPGPFLVANCWFDWSEARTETLVLGGVDSVDFGAPDGTISGSRRRVELHAPWALENTISVVLPEHFRYLHGIPYGRGRPRIRVRMHRGLFGVPWVEADSLRVDATIYDFEILRQRPPEDNGTSKATLPESAPRRFLDQHRGKVLLLGVNVICSDSRGLRALRRLDAIREAFARTSLVIAGDFDCDDCRGFAEVEPEAAEFACELATTAQCHGGLQRPALLVFGKDGNLAGVFDEPYGASDYPGAYPLPALDRLLESELQR